MKKLQKAIHEQKEMTTYKVQFELQKKVLENMIKTNKGLLLQNRTELALQIPDISKKTVATLDKII
jgi:hypothetical protein